MFTNPNIPLKYIFESYPSVAILFLILFALLGGMSTTSSPDQCIAFLTLDE